MRSFGSDNHSGVHRSILEAVTQANNGHAIAYGDDFWTEKAIAEFKNIFGKQAEPFFVFNGTGANVTALQSCLRPFEAAIVPATAHVFADECGSPEFMTRSALKPIPTANGKLTPEHIEPLLLGMGDQHHSQPKVVYISQCSELGTVYTVEEIKALADFLHRHNLYLHIDGARIANAAAFLNVGFKELTADCGADILSFGGTKNGMLMGEAVVSFREELSKNLKFIRKQSAQLYSKMRFVSSQFSAYFRDDLWKQNARHANNMAQKLRKGISSIADFEFTQPTQANILLLKMPPAVIEQMLKKHFFYIWNEQENEIRLVTSWDTAEDDISIFLNDLEKACKTNR
ncbi:MAG: low specificity L-threonine aldolase [Bacteroidales bacterium]|nr:low specificity L-threonine aldolase [Bacteroidales bacterium]